MKKLQVLLFSFCMLLSVASSAQKKQGKRSIIIHRDTSLAKDSIEFYETDFEARQKNYMYLLQGAWDIDIMKRQAMTEDEKLTNVYLVFNADSTFIGNAGCNKISGKYSIKGTGIKFKNITTTFMGCDKQEQENEFLRLLQETVSAYTVSNQSLLLRDGSSNIVFQANRRED